MMQVSNKNRLDTLVKKIKEFPEVMAIILFGSYAKDTAKEISDIDIAVVIKNPDKHIEGEIGSMYSQDFDVVLFHRLPLHIQFEVLKYGKEIFCGMYERIKRRVLA